MRTLNIIASLTLAMAASALAGTSPVTSELPRNARPLAYHIEVTPDAAALRFDGRVRIEVDVLESTRTLTLHANGLHVHTATLQHDKGRGTPLAAKVDAAKETVTFTAPTALAPGHHELSISYDGIIGTQAAGFFALDYTTADGHPERALYTQFESHDARRFVPCFDEPSFRATFELSVRAPAGRMAVSNLPAASHTVEADGRVLWHFPATPPMSRLSAVLGRR
jgi:aminopeptidase N